MNNTNELACKLFPILKEKNNLFFSPYSIYLAMAMMLEGASEEARKQAIEVLGFTPKNDTITAKKVIWEIANSFWIHQEYPIHKTYTQLLETNYLASIFPRDFSNPKTLTEINTWVENKTHGKIKDIISEINPLEIAVLINAVYFKGKWMEQFKKSSTTYNVFYSSGSESKVSMMCQKNHYRCFMDEENSIQGVELPYLGKEVSMTLIMPTVEEPLGKGQVKIKSLVNGVLNEFKTEVRVGSITTLTVTKPKDVKTIENWEKEGLIKILSSSYNSGVEKEESPYQTFLSKITPKQIDKWHNQMYLREIYLHIPKFKIEDSMGLTDIIRQMGITKVFEDNGLSNVGPEVSLSRAIHKSFVEVDEEGTEAAAATAMTFRYKGASATPVFKFDHPFVYFIRHIPTNTIMFMGKIDTLE